MLILFLSSLDSACIIRKKKTRSLNPSERGLHDQVLPYAVIKQRCAVLRCFFACALLSSRRFNDAILFFFSCVFCRFGVLSQCHSLSIASLPPRAQRRGCGDRVQCTLRLHHSGTVFFWGTYKAHEETFLPRIYVAASSARCSGCFPQRWRR